MSGRGVGKGGREGQTDRQTDKQIDGGIVFRLRLSPPRPNSPAPVGLFLILIHSKVCPSFKRSQEERKLCHQGGKGTPEGEGSSFRASPREVGVGSPSPKWGAKQCSREGTLNTPIRGEGPGRKPGTARD